MKKNLSYVILGVIFIIVSITLINIVINKRPIKKEYNVKVGDVLDYEEYDTKVTILNIADILCQNKDKCSNEKEIEVSVKIEYFDKSSNYILRSKSNPILKIENSNNYVTLNYENNKIDIKIKDRYEI